MSGKRSGARQTGAPALTLTRRQQKRARQQQGKRRPAPRQTAGDTSLRQAAQATSSAPVEDTVHAAPTGVIDMADRRGRSARERTQPAPLSQSEGQPEPHQHERQQPVQPIVTRQGTRPRVEARTKSAVEVVGSESREGARAGEYDDTRPVPIARPTTSGMSRRRRPTQSVRPSAPLDSPSASGRKYPTLARMAAAPARAYAPAGEPSAASRSPERPERREWKAAPDTYQWRDRVVSAWAGESSRTPGFTHGWDDVQTEPVPVVLTRRSEARRSVLTRRLSDEQSRVEDTEGTSRSNTGRAAPRARTRLPVATPRTAFVVPLAVTHAAIAALAALASAALLLLNVPGVYWPLSLTAIAGLGGWLAYALAQRGAPRAADAALLAWQFGALVWLLALLGPRAALLAGTPALALLWLRMAGRGAAVAAVVTSFALYVAWTCLALAGVAAPGVALGAAGAALVDGLALALGLGALLVELLDLAHTRTRLELAAQARQHEALLLRARTARLTQQVEDDGARLDAALGRALRGGGIPPLKAEGALSPLAETVGTVADRLMTLQRDREDRLRLEGAVRSVTRAVERAWLGLPWSWPEWSGTAMDELVALLRTPHPQGAREVRDVWSDETPTLVELPALDRSMPQLYPYGAKAANGWSQPLSSARAGARTPVQASSGRITPLPWDEWNQWPAWER